MIEGGELCFVGHCDNLIVEGGFKRLFLVIFTVRFLVIYEYPVIFPGKFPCGYIGVPTRVQWVDRQHTTDKFIFGWW